LYVFFLYRLQQVPVKLEIEGTLKINATFDAHLKFNLNFYAFESQTPTPNAFDISSLCAKGASSQMRRLSSGAIVGIAVASLVLGLMF